ncbi:hypothetical protein IAU60_004524 [Kwoniella sp. DSM 27419]
MMFPSRSLTSLLLVPSIASWILSALPAVAYIPAVAVNDTTGLNFTDSSTIAISWTWTDPQGTYSGKVSFQLRADVPTGGTTSGALVHFSESNMGPNQTTSTPWIAYISCDVNETSWSNESDVFTLARDRGAVSALLYTAHAQSCLLNQEYITDFEKPLDVFATKTVQVARLIDNQFVHTNDTFSDYNGTLLNISGTDVNNWLAGNPPTLNSFLLGTLTARNSTGQATATTIPNAQPTTDGSGGGGSKKTSAPMIVLYAVTGVVSTMFIAMLIMGARRAMLHPERYGRREGDDQQGPQSAAGGLAQAILDTFPIIKYNRHAMAGIGTGGSSTPHKRLSSENNMEGVMMRDVANRDVERGQYRSYPMSTLRRSGTEESYAESSKSVFGVGEENGGPRASGSGSTDVVMAEDETMVEGQQCPICLVDFEPGEDLRVLPCEREHVYHQSCIDPWLLQVSSSCPLCRKDFNAPANTTADTASGTSPSPHSSTFAADQTQIASAEGQSQPPTQHGFARYLAFMRRQRRSEPGPHRDRNRDRGLSGTSRSGTVDALGYGRGRRREADQTGPGGY